MHRISARNLLSNACKLSKPGTPITFRLDQNEANALHLSIADEGIDIPDENISAVLKPFVQVKKSDSRMFDSIGPGLSIVRSIAEVLGVEITIDNSVGHSTKVGLLIPHPVGAAEKNRNRLRQADGSPFTLFDPGLLAVKG